MCVGGVGWCGVPMCVTVSWHVEGPVWLVYMRVGCVGGSVVGSVVVRCVVVTRGCVVLVKLYIVVYRVFW